MIARYYFAGVRMLNCILLYLSNFNRQLSELRNFWS